ncbi:hypothetical protein [Pantanalinema sp. GBBB05]|uniref:hypothetical protein n=1 Tax=Pantanalinema sp. GBBB05 TaxID=2604139 RepID=UPI001D714619|nr:hypothetical protein [Pantanalinema sp. GBBB05]
MCVTCMLTSALLLFTPSGSDLSVQQPRSLPLAQDAQVAITEVVKRIPANATTQALRQGLQQLHGKLAATTSDQEAKVVLDQELLTLRDRIAADPNAEQMNQVLEDLVIPNEPLPELEPSPQSSLKQQRWGWIK